MTGTITPESFETEEIMNIPVASSGTQCRVISGYANFFDKGNTNVYGAPIGLDRRREVMSWTHSRSVATSIRTTTTRRGGRTRCTWRSVLRGAACGTSRRSSQSRILVQGQRLGRCVGNRDPQLHMGHGRVDRRPEQHGTHPPQGRRPNVRGADYSIIKLAYHLVAVGRGIGPIMRWRPSRQISAFLRRIRRRTSFISTA